MSEIEIVAAGGARQAGQEVVVGGRGGVDDGQRTAKLRRGVAGAGEALRVAEGVDAVGDEDDARVADRRQMLEQLDEIRRARQRRRVRYISETSLNRSPPVCCTLPVAFSSIRLSCGMATFTRRPIISVVRRL